MCCGVCGQEILLGSMFDVCTCTSIIFLCMCVRLCFCLHVGVVIYDCIF